MFKKLRSEIRAVKDSDPAAPSAFLIFISYPGIHANVAHRFQNFLWRHHLKGLARYFSQCTRFFTGIEIHPAAEIGDNFFIDHGMGVVIGETTIIKNNVTLYQGVTLGGTGKDTGKRHPTIENGVIVGVGASVLGNITIGENSKIGGGAVVVYDVPPNCTVVGVPGRVVIQDGQKTKQVSNAQPDKRRESLPDPTAEAIADLQERLLALEKIQYQQDSQDEFISND